jgi:hypothetical protein
MLLLVIATAFFSPVQIGLAATDWWMVDLDTGECTRSAEIATKEGSIAVKTPEQLIVFLLVGQRTRPDAQDKGDSEPNPDDRSDSTPLKPWNLEDDEHRFYSCGFA